MSLRKFTGSAVSFPVAREPTSRIAMPTNRQIRWGFLVMKTDVARSRTNSVLPYSGHKDVFAIAVVGPTLSRFSYGTAASYRPNVPRFCLFWLIERLQGSTLVGYVPIESTIETGILTNQGVKTGALSKHA